MIASLKALTSDRVLIIISSNLKHNSMKIMNATETVCVKMLT